MKKNKSDLTKLSKEDLEKELKRRNEIENVFKVKDLKKITDKEKITIFNELYSNTLLNIEEAIEQNYQDEDMTHFCFEKLMTELFGKDVFKECLNKIGGKDKVKIKIV